MKVVILGSTGSIGSNTLDVLSRHPEKFQVHALTANKNVAELCRQCVEYQPEFAVMVDGEAANQLRIQLKEKGCKTEIFSGEKALCEAVDEGDIVVAGIVGAAGLLPTLTAAKAGKRLLLANKEPLVMAGDLFMQAVKKGGATLLPLDSEHNAIFQCLPQAYSVGDKPEGVKRLILTASGGPFRELAIAELKNVSPEQACAHPNWVMGKKISVDSATMMNKGLELIEAHYLFGMTPDVILHPQSVVHSMVEYLDGSILAQLGSPDMRTPIACGLAWPERISAGVSSLDFVSLGRLDFSDVPTDRYPCLLLAQQALTAGGTSMAILNAANEVAVEAFLQGRIAFTEIAESVERVLEDLSNETAAELEIVLEADRKTRELAWQSLII